jgi:hypothetical protein
MSNSDDSEDRNTIYAKRFGKFVAVGHVKKQFSKEEWESRIRLSEKTLELIDERADDYDIDKMSWAVRETIDFEDSEGNICTEVTKKKGFLIAFSAYEYFEYMERREKNPKVHREVFRQTKDGWQPDADFDRGLVPHLNRESQRPQRMFENTNW